MSEDYKTLYDELKSAAQSAVRAIDSNPAGRGRSCPACNPGEFELHEDKCPLVKLARACGLLSGA